MQWKWTNEERQRGKLYEFYCNDSAKAYTKKSELMEKQQIGWHKYNLYEKKEEKKNKQTTNKNMILYIYWKHIEMIYKNKDYTFKFMYYDEFRSLFRFQLIFQQE